MSLHNFLDGAGEYNGAMLCSESALFYKANVQLSSNKKQETDTLTKTMNILKYALNT